MATANTTRRPVHEVRMGRIKAAIWENKTEQGMRHNVSITRIDKNGNTRKDSTSFGRDDLPLVTKIADVAHMWIYANASTAPATTDEPADF